MVHRGPYVWGVGQQLGDWRLVRDEGSNLVGMTGGKGRSGDGPATAGEHVGWFAADGIDHESQIVGLDLRCDAKRRVVDCALAEPARVIGHHCVSLGEQVGNGANGALVIGWPMTRKSGPDPRTS